MTRRTRLVVALTLALGSSCCLAQFTEGQSVEVREGDTWSPATVLKKEGRRFQIRYQGSTEDEWVTTDRVRAPGANPSAASGQGAPPESAPAAATSPYKIGQEVESKRGATWRTAKVQKLENGWILVLYPQGNFMEWVEPWRIRPTGSKDDAIGNAPMNKEAKQGDPAPSTPPAEAPSPLAGVAGWREPVVGDHVLYLDGWKTQPARVIAQKGDQLQIQLDEGRTSKNVDSKDVRVAGFRLDAKVGQRVQIREPGGWTSGTVMARESDRARIMKDGWPHEMHHVWKSLEEIRPAGANDVPPIDSASADELRKLPGYKEANASSARQLNLMVSRGTQYAPDVIPTTDLPPVQLSTISGANDTYSPKAIAVSRAGKFAVVSSHAMRKDTAVIDRIDLASGNHLNTVQLPVPADMVVMDVSGDGTRVLMGVPRTGERLEIWSADGATPKRQLLFFPYADGKSFLEKQVRYAAIVGDDRLLTINGANTLYLWDTTTGRAVYTCPAWSECRPGVSPSGKYIALSTGKDAVVMDAATGKGIIDLPLELAGARALAFSADGSELVACDATNVYAVDLAAGKLTANFALPGSNVYRSIASPGNGLALANESILIDLKTKSPVWKYKLGMQVVSTTTPAGQIAFTYTGGRVPMLATATVPHASAMKQLQNLPQRKMLLEPGKKVTLSINLSGADSEREKIAAYMKEQLTSNGFDIAENQPLRLVVSLDRGQAIQQEYRSGPSFGPFARPSEHVSIAPWISRIRLENEGKVVWQVTTTSGGPSFILMKREGQSAQQAAEDQNKPNTGIFTSTRIPAYMVMPENPLYKFESDFTGRMFHDMPATPEAQPDPNNPNMPVIQPDGKVA